MLSIVSSRMESRFANFAALKHTIVARSNEIAALKQINQSHVGLSRRSVELKDKRLGGVSSSGALKRLQVVMHQCRHRSTKE
jgi:hypothetical protein